MTNARNLADVGRIEGLSLNNAIINGNFDIWQRGASASGAGYSADRWIHNVASPSGTVTQSRQSFTIGQTDVPNEPTYFYRIQGSSYTMTAGNVAQKIEDVRTFAGQTVTLSFYAKASATRDIRPRFLQFFNGSANIDTFTDPVSLTTSWQKFITTVSIPSIAGKTVGASSRLELTFDIKEGAFGSDLGSDSIDIAQVKLEAGSVATPFRPRPIAEELALCQRYYWKGLPFLTFNMGAYTANVYQTMSFAFPVPMRAIPSLTYDFSGATFALGLTVLNVAAHRFLGSRILFLATQATTNANVTFDPSDFIAADAEL